MLCNALYRVAFKRRVLPCLDITCLRHSQDYTVSLNLTNRSRDAIGLPRIGVSLEVSKLKL